VTGEDEELAQIMREFRASLLVRIADMRSEMALAQKGDAEARDRLQTLAHRLRGSAGSFGLAEIGEVARIIENECKIGPNWNAVLAAIEAIEAIVAIASRVAL
jgi:HPt (histidine-containing phosphotransfer) domain-containing protein